MGKTFIHKFKAKNKQGFELSILELNIVRGYFNRSNSERSYFKPIQLAKKEKIADMEMKNALHIRYIKFSD